jgi:DNA-binding transcriptional LysR family regulator
LFDIGFATLPVETNQLIVDELIDTEAICLIPKHHPLAACREICLEQLSGQHLVVPNQPNIAGDQLLRLISKQNIRIVGKTEANIASICSLVGNGVGISVMNPITAHDLAHRNMVVNGVGISVMNPITAHDLAHRNMVVKPFIPSIHYSFGMVYQEKWRDNKMIQTIKEDLPEYPRYLSD